MTEPTPRRLLVSGGAVCLTWMATRMAMAWLWHARGQFLMNDVSYYFYSLHRPNAAALTEYPTPVLWLLRLFQALAAGNFGTFLDLFVGLMVILDALITVFLFWRASPLAAGYWVVYLALLGPIIWFRIDLIPAACVTLGLLVLTSWPRHSGVLLAIGAATKMWPALLILPTLGRGATAKARLIGFAAAGGVLAAASLVLDGWGRSVSPIAWQAERGLQIESLCATWPMILHATRKGAVIVRMSPYHAYQVTGTGVAAGETAVAWLTGATIALVLVLTLLLAVRPALADRRRPGVARPPHTYAVVVAATAIIAAMIASNKTFSPQYLIWLGGPLGLVLTRAPSPGDRRAGVVAAGLGLTIAGLTQAVFPLDYAGLVSYPLGNLGVTSLLVARNALMAVLMLWLVWWAL